jgi:hypothetical protein
MGHPVDESEAAVCNPGDPPITNGTAEVSRQSENSSQAETVLPFRQRSILKTRPSADSIRRTVSWMDFDGKDLHTVREFEARWVRTWRHCGQHGLCSRHRLPRPGRRAPGVPWHCPARSMALPGTPPACYPSMLPQLTAVWRRDSTCRLQASRLPANTRSQLTRITRIALRHVPTAASVASPLPLLLPPCLQ